MLGIAIYTDHTWSSVYCTDNMLSRTQVLIVTVLPCRTKFLSDDWMEQSGFIEPVLEGVSSKFW